MISYRTRFESLEETKIALNDASTLEDRKEIYRRRIERLSSRQEIWKSRWTELLNPPPKNFYFSLKVIIPIAKVALENDEELKMARYMLVPGKISEYEFWRSYLWHIKQLREALFPDLSWEEGDSLDLTILSLKDVMLAKRANVNLSGKPFLNSPGGILSVYSLATENREEKSESSDLGEWMLPVVGAPPQRTLHTAPWEIEPHKCWKVAVFQGRLLNQRASALSSLRIIWTMDNGKLLNSPPESFPFSLDEFEPHASTALCLDEGLRNAFNDLVPESLSEFEFWRVYCWHIELLKLDVQAELQANGKGVDDFPLYSIEEEGESKILHKIYFESHPLARLLILRQHVRSRINSMKPCNMGVYLTKGKRNRRVQFQV